MFLGATLKDNKNHSGDRNTVLVVGASGVVGSAAVRQFAAAGWQVIGTSRREPVIDAAYDYVPMDLESPESVAASLQRFSEVTHIVYAALFEMPELVAGWRSQQQIQTNQRMLENLFEPLLKITSSLRQVILLQGGKAYGAHVGQLLVPAKESAARVEHANFYWLQEDYLRAVQVDYDWGLTIFRPQIVFGDALNAAMNLIPAIGVYGALLKEQGRALHYPGGESALLEAVDADLLGDAFIWAFETPEALNETFNVTNGDVFVWQNVWPVIAEALGMEAGDNKPCLLAETLPQQVGDWNRIVSKYGLVAPEMDYFVGQGFQYADVLFATGAKDRPPPKLLSTIKIRQAGFGRCIDTEDMFRKWFGLFQQRRLLPLP